MTKLRNVAVSAVLAGAAGSIAFMLYAGRGQPSRILTLLFGIWVLSPFFAALMVSRASERWAGGIRRTLYVLIVILALASLAVCFGKSPGRPESSSEQPRPSMEPFSV